MLCGVKKRRTKPHYTTDLTHGNSNPTLSGLPSCIDEWRIRKVHELCVQLSSLTTIANRTPSLVRSRRQGVRWSTLTRTIMCDVGREGSSWISALTLSAYATSPCVMARIATS